MAQGIIATLAERGFGFIRPAAGVPTCSSIARSWRM